MMLAANGVHTASLWGKRKSIVNDIPLHRALFYQPTTVAEEPLSEDTSEMRTPF